MGANVKIEVDERTADALKTRDTELGVTVSELVAELAALDTDPVVVESDEIAELDRRSKKVKAGESTVPHERVVRWLRTWGTPRFRPWQDQSASTGRKTLSPTSIDLPRSSTINRPNATLGPSLDLLRRTGNDEPQR